MLTATCQSNPGPCRHGSLRYTLQFLFPAIDRNDPVQAGVEEMRALESIGLELEEEEDRQ